MPLSKDIKIIGTNGAIFPELVMRKHFHLFPTGNFKDAELIVLDKKKNRSHGSAQHEDDYKLEFFMALQELELTHEIIYSSQFHQIWQKL